MVKTFKVKITKRNYSTVDYNYRVLSLIPDEEALDEWNDDASEEVKVMANQEPSEESIKSLPGLVTERGPDNNTSNQPRINDGGFKFMKRMTNQSNTDANQNTAMKMDENSDPLLPAKESDNFTEDQKKMMVGNDSQSSKITAGDNLPNQKSKLKVTKADENIVESAYEFDSPEKGEGTNVYDLDRSGNTEKMLDLQIQNNGKKSAFIRNEYDDSPRSNQSMGYSKANQNINNREYHHSSNRTIEDRDEFDEQLNFSDLNRKKNAMEGTGSVVTNTHMQVHKKYYAFEDAVQKDTNIISMMILIVTYLIALAANVFFPLYIKYSFSEKNSMFENTSKLLTTTYDHQLINQIFYNRLLRAVAFNRK